MTALALPRKRHLLPGFGLTLGVTLLYVVIIIVLPVSAMLFKTASLGFDEFWRIVTSNRSLAAYRITFGSAAVATVFNGAFGLLLAWVLVRYEFRGKRALDALVDLPFALPTAVAGLTLVTLFAKNGWYGQFLEPLGIKVNYTQLGIIIAMVFTSIPFVVRTVQPVLEEVEADIEEAAMTLGATPWQVFSRVVWPAIMPAFITGCVLSFARSLGEFGAVVFIAGNLPGLTEIVSLLIYIRLDEYNYPAAAGLATVLLATAFFTLFLTNSLQAWHLRYADRKS
ncbi:sulfate/thiosulfate transporter subunit [Devosia limi DSM 17137]|uniref:Molybdenum transport system permease n=1 Tax=Devosia limi DSM 17137 TaxID=1121477 RepID=A0A0F5LU89_9HYPH|nr:sulfate ABC transporter permease subunit CysT [Devosia limi]KKB85851.1 sulfate/thiosulfate transporter subunit [Devosia limi DSM 17137]SHE35553.1 sulfate transport system permease protein [Devosia limi DSM 17137]